MQNAGTAAEVALESQALFEELSKLLSGRGPEVQSAALADAVAMWLARNIALRRDGTLDRRATDALRADLFRHWIAAVHDLVGENEKLILARLQASRAMH